MAISKIILLREQLGYKTANSFAEFLGVPNIYIYRYEKGQQNPGRKFIEKLKAKIPNLNEAYFFDDSAPMFKQQEPAVTQPVKSINIYERVAAGQPIALWDDPIESIEVSHPAIARRKELYGFVVAGDSMLPRFRNGDYVITQKLNLPEITNPVVRFALRKAL